MSTMSFARRSFIRGFVSSRRAAGVLLAASTLAACSADRMVTSGTARPVTLSFMTSPVRSAAAVTGAAASVNIPAPSADLVAASGQDTLVITKAQVVLSRLELTSGTGAECDDDAGPSCREVERAFVLVDLPTDTTVRQLVDAVIPPGTYSSLEARIRVPRADSDSSAASFLAAHPEFAGADVRVEGTFRGVPFVYTGTVNARLGLAFSPPVVVDSTGLNITVHVDLTTWFRDASGGLVDPATANAGGANAALVANNIGDSFRAFRDDHQDGHDDGDGEHAPE